jgi:hypothetical protein
MLALAFMAGLPPSTGSIMPVTMDAAAEARNNTGAHQSLRTGRAAPH